MLVKYANRNQRKKKHMGQDGPGSLTWIFEMTIVNFFVVFKEELTKISLCPYSASSPHSLMPCYWQIKITRTIFEKCHPMNISMKLFQNLTSGFREDFLRICSCPYSKNSPHSLEPCLMMDHNFTNNFEKGHWRNISVKLFQNLTSGFREKDFIRISPCPYSAKCPHSPEPCLLTDETFVTNFWKGSPKEHSILWNYFKIWPAVPEEKIFKELLKKFLFLTMASNSLTNF